MELWLIEFVFKIIQPIEQYVASSASRFFQLSAYCNKSVFYVICFYSNISKENVVLHVIDKDVFYVEEVGLTQCWWTLKRNSAHARLTCILAEPNDNTPVTETNALRTRLARGLTAITDSKTPDNPQQTFICKTKYIVLSGPILSRPNCILDRKI